MSWARGRLTPCALAQTLAGMSHERMMSFSFYCALAAVHSPQESRFGSTLNTLRDPPTHSDKYVPST